MPRAEILSTQAIHTLRELHAELAGKIIDNKLEADRLRLQTQQVVAVMKMLQPDIDIRPIAVRRKPNHILQAKGVTEPDKKAARELWGPVNSSLQNHKG